MRRARGEVHFSMGSGNINYARVSQNLFARAPNFGFEKITTDPGVLAHVNTDCPFDRYPKLKMCISELIIHTHVMFTSSIFALMQEVTRQ